MIIAALLALIAFVIAVAEWGRSKQETRLFIERQQLQSKIDTLTEHLLQQAGHPVDLNKNAREKFKSALHRDRPFAHLKNDTIATPPKEK